MKKFLAPLAFVLLASSLSGCFYDPRGGYDRGPGYVGYGHGPGFYGHGDNHDDHHDDGDHGGGYGR